MATNWDAARSASRRPLRRKYKPVAPVGNEALNRSIQNLKDGSQVFVLPVPMTSGDHNTCEHGHLFCFKCRPPAPAVDPTPVPVRPRPGFPGGGRLREDVQVPRGLTTDPGPSVQVVSALARIMGEPPYVSSVSKYRGRPAFIYYRDLPQLKKDEVDLLSRRHGLPIEVGAPSALKPGFLGVWTGETYLAWKVVT
jgi:hypothetical protein